MSVKYTASEHPASSYCFQLTATTAVPKSNSFLVDFISWCANFMASLLKFDEVKGTCYGNHLKACNRLYPIGQHDGGI